MKCIQSKTQLDVIFSYLWSQVGIESTECPKDFWQPYDQEAAECLTDPTKTDNVHVKCEPKSINK